MAGATYAAIEQSLERDMPGKVNEVKGKLADFVSNLDFQGTVLDREMNRIVTRVDSEVAGVGRVRGMSVGAIGSQGIVFLHCYAKEADFPKYLPTFNEIIDSFQYDPGFTFTPAQTPSVPGQPFRGLMDMMGSGMVGAVIGAIAGLFAGGVVALFFAIFKRRKKPFSTRGEGSQRDATPRQSL